MTRTLEEIRQDEDKADGEQLTKILDQRLKLARELGFDRGVSVVASLLMKIGLHELAIEYITNLMATPLSEKLASLDYGERAEIIADLNPRKGTAA